MIDNIPEVSYMDITAFPKEMHIGYVKNVVRRIDEEWDVEVPAPAKLQTQITPLKTAVAKEDLDYEQSRKSSLTEDVARADNERDSLLNQATTMIDTMAKMSAMPLMQQAALTMQGPLQVYKPSAKSALRDESTDIEQWLQAISQSAEQQQAAQTLGLTQILSDLGQKNQEVITLMDERAAERAAQATVQLSEDRKETDRCLRNFLRMLNALATVDDDETHFNVIIGRLTEDQKEWRQRYEANRRANRRVSVKSTIVGNHLYQTSNGWTWERLIEEGKALLAVDPDTDRIVSTDKKAEKAGGLILALLGQPVGPDDEVDVTKEYELIAPPSES